MTTPRVNAELSRRPDIESDLKNKYHVQYEYRRNLNVEEHFDIEKSLANQARFEPLDLETVELYREAVLRGDPFPAVLAYRPGRAAGQKLVIVDGNHRMIGYRDAGVPINVYELDRSTKAQVITFMTFAFNTKHGRPSSEDERTVHALHLVESGSTQENAAAELNVPLRILKKAYLLKVSQQRAEDAGINPREWESLAQVARVRLQTTSTDEGFKEAAHLAYIAALNGEEVAELVTLLNTSKSAQRQRGLVKSETDRYRDRIQTGGAGLSTGASPRTKSMSPRTRVATVLGQVLSLPDDFRSMANSWAEPEREDAATRVEDAAQKLHKLALELNPSLR